MSASRRLVFGRYDYATFLSYFVYAAGTVAVPVTLVALSKDLGFSLEHGGMTAGGALHLIRSMAIVAAMLLCGFVAGRTGKRLAMGLAVLLLATGLAFCAMAPSYPVLLLALLLAGFGEGTFEGLATPFVHDLHPQESGRYINFTHSFWSVGVLVTVLAGGWLLADSGSWRTAMGAVSALAFVAALWLLLPTRTHGHAPPEDEPAPWRKVAGQAKAIMRMPRFWLFFAAMFLAGGGEFCLTYWSASYLQINFGTGAFGGGAGVACFAGGMILGRSGWGCLIHQQRLNRLVLCSALAGTVVTFLLPWQTRAGGLMLLLFFAGICTAPFWPSIQSYSADRLSGADKTMLLIMLSCAGIPGCGFFTWLMGLMANRYGLRPAFFLVPGCYLGLAALMAVDRRSRQRIPQGGLSPAITG
jgi:fucose permease